MLAEVPHTVFESTVFIYPTLAGALFALMTNVEAR